MKKGMMLAGLSALWAVAGFSALAQDKPFQGVTVNLMTQTGAIQEPLQRRAPDFEALTGAKINVIAVPFSDLYQKILTDWASGTNSVDAARSGEQQNEDTRQRFRKEITSFCRVARGAHLPSGTNGGRDAHASSSTIQHRMALRVPLAVRLTCAAQVGSATPQGTVGTCSGERQAVHSWELAAPKLPAR